MTTGNLQISLSTIIISLSQIPFLFILKYFKFSFLKPKKRFIISLFIVWTLFLFTIIKVENYDNLFLFSSFLFLICSNIVCLTLWSLLSFGFTVNLLTSLPLNKTKLSKNDWIKKYTNGNNLIFFTLDRLPILKNIGLININKKNISISAYGVYFNKIILILKFITSSK